MKPPNYNYKRTSIANILLPFVLCISTAQAQQTKRLLYVTEPGIRNYLEYGGHGIRVYDMDRNFALVKRIATGSYDSTGQPSNVKGVCVSLATQCIYVSTIKSLMCISLATENIRWEKTFPEGCDRMAISNDGLTIFQPSFENDRWYIIDARTGNMKDEVFLIPNLITRWLVLMATPCIWKD